MTQKKTIKSPRKFRWFRRSLRVMLALFLFVVFVVVAALVMIQMPPIQTKLSNYALEKINEDFGTQIEVDSVDIDFWGDINLYGLSAKDKRDSTFIQIPRLKLATDLWALAKNQEQIALDYIKLYQPNIQVITYKGDKESNFIELINSFDDGKPSKNNNFRLSGGIDIEDGTLGIVNQNLAPTEQVWLDAKDFQAKIRNFVYKKDDIQGDIRQLAFSSLHKNKVYDLKQLHTAVRYTPQGISLDELELETGDSHIFGSMKLNYESIAAFDNFLEEVLWDIRLSPDSKIAYRDIQYGYPDWTGKETISLGANITGPIRDWKIEDLDLGIGEVRLKASQLELFDIDSDTQYSIAAKGLDLNSSLPKLQRSLPSFVAKKIPSFFERFGQFAYRGDLNLDAKDLSAKGLLKSSLGDANLQILLTDFTELDRIAYSGALKTKDFDLGKISGVKELNKIAGDLSFSGVGTELADLAIQAKGKIGFIDYLNRRYQNIEVDGAWKNQIFDGFLGIKDNQLNGDYTGIIDTRAAPYYLEFKSNLRSVNLDYLGLTKNNSRIAGQVSGAFHLSDANDFLGKITLQNVDFRSNANAFKVANITLDSRLNGDTKTLEVIIPEYLNANITGEYVLTELPDAILNSFGEILPNYTYAKVRENQFFNFRIELIDDIIQQFYPELEIAPNSILEGEVNTNEKQAYALLESDKIRYAGIDFHRTNIQINTLNPTRPLTIQTDSINLEGVILKEVRLFAVPQNDALQLKADFFTGEKNPVFFDLDLLQTFDEQNNVVLAFSPSTVTINDTPWLVNPQNLPNTNWAVLDVDQNRYSIENIKLQNGIQSLALNGFYFGKENFEFTGELNDLLLQEIIPQEAMGSTQLEGTAQGRFNIKRDKEGLQPIANLSINDILLNTYQIGNLTLDGEYDEIEKVFNLKGELYKGIKQAILVEGYIDNKPEEPELSLTANLNDLDMDFLGSFLNGVVSNVRGMSSGTLLFDGPISAPNYNGSISVADLGFKVDYLNVDYVFTENNLQISKQGEGQGVIFLNELEFTDTRFNTVGSTSGVLLFRKLSEWFFNLSFNTDKLLVLNTSERNNELFYGKLFGKGKFHFEGTPEDLLLEADAELIDASNFTINTGSYFVDTNSNLVRFVPVNEELDGADKVDRPTGITMNMNIAVTPSTAVQLIFDSSSNDLLEARGTSKRLGINMNSKGDLSMKGEYVLESGQYRFRRIPGLTKDFNIQKGSSIQWSNSPYDATLDITAAYPKIVSNIGDYLGVGFSQAYEVLLFMRLTETLEKPNIGFNLDIPKASNDIQSQLATRLNANPDEKLRQFSFILLTGQFGTTNTNALESGFTSAAAEIALRQISNVLSAIAKEFQIDFNYTEGDNLSQTSDRFGARLSLALHPRWTLKTTGGIPLDNVFDENLTLEVEAEYDISDKIDRSTLVSGFSRPTTFGVENFNNASAATQSYGAGISFTKSFDNIKDIFKSKKRIAREAELLDSLRKANKLRMQQRELEKKATPIDSLPKSVSNKIDSSSVIPSRPNERSSNASKQSKAKKSRGLVRFK